MSSSDDFKKFITGQYEAPNDYGSSYQTFHQLQWQQGMQNQQNYPWLQQGSWTVPQQPQVWTTPYPITASPYISAYPEPEPVPPKKEPKPVPEPLETKPRLMRKAE